VRAVLSTFVIVIVAAFQLGGAAPCRAAEVTVFAAASLKNALDEVAAGWQAATGNAVSISYAGSARLARQIEQGAPADLFISANTAWMDYLGDAGLIDEASRRDLLGNRLVLVAHGPAAVPVELAPGVDLASRLGDGRLAMALVDAVPAGIYGKAALEHLGLWASVADRTAQTDNVRAALALVALGEAPLGIVYATDAVAEDGVTVVATFPEDSHPPIVYPVALTVEARQPAAVDLLAWLGSAAARGSFERQGFSVLD
jgi:molybdate transport system substrate-binding protein